MISSRENRVILKRQYRNQWIKLTLEFPKQPDKAAAQAFTDRIKELYFRKIERSSVPLQQKENGEADDE